MVDDGLGDAVGIEHPDRPRRIGVDDGEANILHADPHGGDRDRIDAHAHRRLLGAVDADLGDAVDLGQALRQHRVGDVVDRARRQSVRGQRQDENRGGVRIGLAEARQVRQIARQVGDRGIEGRLHVPGGAVDAAGDVELDRNRGRAERTRRRELDDAGDFAKPALERCRHRRRHGRGIGTRPVCRDVDGRKLDVGECRDGQEFIRDRADQEHPDGEQYGGDRPRDEGQRKVQREPPLRPAKIAAAVPIASADRGAPADPASPNLA